MSIGLRIKDLRTSAELSQIDFAKSIGITRGNLGQIEIGKQLPTIKIITSIVKIYHTSYTFLIEGQFDKSKEGELVSDPVVKYKVTCPGCIEKDKRISYLEGYIDSLKENSIARKEEPEPKNSTYSQTGSD